VNKRVTRADTLPSMYLKQQNKRLLNFNFYFPFKKANNPIDLQNLLQQINDLNINNTKQLNNFLQELILNSSIIQNFIKNQTSSNVCCQTCKFV
jgi:hypothetical protein